MIYSNQETSTVFNYAIDSTPLPDRSGTVGLLPSTLPPSVKSGITETLWAAIWWPKKLKFIDVGGKSANLAAKFLHIELFC